MTKQELQLNERLTGLENKLDNILAFLQNGQFSGLTSNCNYTFGEWLFRWLEMYKRPVQSGEVYRWNLKRIENKIIPSLGNIFLKNLTADDIQNYINSLPPSNARNKILHIFSGSLRKAFDLGYIMRNPFRAVESVKNKSESYPVIQPRLQLKLLKLIDNPKYLQMFKFYCCTGFRLSEGLAIDPRKDIDRMRRIIKLNIPNQKTKKHQREVPYLPELFKDFDLSKPTLFPGITHNSARQYFSKLFKRNKINAVIHSFRHTFISCCNHVGIPSKYIQEWAGHSSITMTMDTYTHILEHENTWILDYLKRLKKELKI